MDAYTGKDTIIVNDYMGEFVLSDLADGVCAELVANNDLSSTSTGFNGNSLGAHNEPGRQRELTLRLVKGSEDEKRLNKSYNFWKQRNPLFRPFTMKFIKRVEHGDGNATEDTVKCYFGLPSGQPGHTADTTGNTDQVVAVYMIRFGNSEHSM